MRTLMPTRRGGDDMSGKSIISNSYLEDIGDAIRYKKGTDETFYPSQMGDAIRSIEGIVPVGSIEIDANGVYNVTEKAEAVVSVNPDLRPLSVSENGTYQPDDFDGYSDVTVDVPVGLVLIDTIEVNGVNGVQTDIDMSWFDDYDYIMMVPDLTFSALDWPYLVQDVTTEGEYGSRVLSLGLHNNVILNPLQGQLWFCWFRESNIRPMLGTVVSYLYWHLYSASNTMTGTIKVYGIKVTA